MSAEGWPESTGGPCLLERYPGASANMRPFDSLSSRWQGEGGCVCAQAGVRREYNPFVFAVAVATAVMKNKNWINKTYFFLSGVAIRHRLPNLPPVCASRNARLRQSAQLCLNRGPLPVTPGGACSTTHTWGLWPPEEQRGDSEASQKQGDRPEKWIIPRQRECVLSNDVCHTASAQAESSASRLSWGTSERTSRNRPLRLNQAWLIHRCRACLSSDD